MERIGLGDIAWTDLQATDPDAQYAFYEALFGWTHEDMPTGPDTPDYRMFFKDGVMTAGGNVMSPDMAGAPSFWAVYVATPDLDATLAKATSLGAAVIMPAMDVLESGRMAAIADPTGGAVFFWQANKHPGAGLFMAPGAISWADLSTPDPQAAADFFGELVGWEYSKMDDPQPYWQVQVDGEGQAGIMPMPDTMGPDARPFWSIYFGTEDLEGSLEQVVALGGSVVMTPVDIGNDVSFAVASDPAGAVSCLLGPMGA